METKEKGKTESNTLSIHTILTKDEVLNIVKSFIKAYIYGRIFIEFPTSSELIEISERSGKIMGTKEADEEMANSKLRLIELMEICVGTIESTKTEFDKSISELFKYILLLRSSKRIQGEFRDFSLEKRMTEMELQLKANYNVVNELINWLTEEAKADDMYRLPK